MNNLFDPDSVAFKYLWLTVIALIGGIIGYFRKQWQKDISKTVSEKIRSALLSIVTSMFVAYISYEALIFLTGTVNISVALAGLASFAGTDLLVAVEEGLISGLMEAIKKIGGKK